MTTLLIADHRDNILSQHTARALTAALALGGDVHILVAGHQVGPVAEAAARLAGASKVLVADGEALAHQLPEPLAELVVSLAGGYDAIVASATSSGKSALPRVAALLDVMQVSDVIDVVDSTTFRRPIYAGNAIQTVQSSDGTRVLTIRTAAFDAAGQTTPVAIETVAVPGLAQPSIFVGENLSRSNRPDLGGARAVVSGGRALGSKEQFDALILPLADKLGAAIGASRAAVDAGYAPNDWQVGQTGKIVAPELYIACGISGAIQHVAGMQDARIVVAINKDADAPIFQIADYGLVADLFTALPELTKSLLSLSSVYGITGHLLRNHRLLRPPEGRGRQNSLP
jgi:electron transfer flavoprotein alpha subunit